MLELPRGGKIRAQDAAVESARGEIVAFSDANALWEPEARACSWARSPIRAWGTRADRSASSRPPPGRTRVIRRASTGATSWPCALYESRLSSITAGNGAIYATRRDSYIVVDPIMGHDLSLPFNMVRRGLRATYVPAARASEKMVPRCSASSRASGA